MIIESNPLKLEYIIIIFLLIIAIILLFYKSVEPEKTIKETKKTKSILKTTNDTQSVNNSKVKFYDVRMSQISNDIDITKNQEPTIELLSQYQPAREDIPTNNIFCNSNNGKIQNKPLRFNI